MLQRLIVLVCLLTGLACAEEPLHVYYYNGETIEQLTVRGVTVSVSLDDTGKFNQLAVFVSNSSPDAVNVLPSSFTLRQSSPKDVNLALKSETEIQCIAGKHALWTHVASGVTSSVTYMKEKMAGEDSQSTETAVQDYDAQARWLAHIDQLGKQGEIKTLVRSYLRSTTVFPDSKLPGVLWFDRADVFASGMVKVALGTRVYSFPFPPPSWATTPPNPGKIEKASRRVPLPVEAANSADTAQPKAAVLGVYGENWSQDSFGGVRIVEVAENSAAELASLRVGYVITEIDGKRILTTDDLGAELAKRGPGTRVHIVYLVHTNLGWMPQKLSAILAVGE
jgi:PDZ domain-containing protein